jgi:hypothetical protein
MYKFHLYILYLIHIVHVKYLEDQLIHLYFKHHHVGNIVLIVYDNLEMLLLLFQLVGYGLQQILQVKVV